MLRTIYKLRLKKKSGEENEMAKENPLNAGLKKQKAKKGTSSKSDAAHRRDTVLVAGHFNADVQKGLRIIAAEQSTTVQALLAEGINMVFSKHGRPEIANSTNAAAPEPEAPAPVEGVTA